MVSSPSPDEKRAAERVSLVDMEDGDEGTVVEVRRGRNGTARLDGIGIRVGVKVRKVSGFRLRGPVTVRVGHSHVAIGYGMASNVFVDGRSEGGGS